MKAQVLVPALIALIAVSIASAMVIINSDSQVAGVNNAPGMKTALVLEVYKANGEKQVIRKEGDLILKNLPALLIKFIGSNADPEDEDKVVLITGSVVSGSFSDGNSNGNTGKYKAKIRIGSGTNPPGINDYALHNELAAFEIQNADLLVSGNNMTIHVYGSYTAQSNMTITEIGLSIEGIDNGNQPFLIFRDVLTQPITLNAGDTISVHYYLTFYNP